MSKVTVFSAKANSEMEFPKELVGEKNLPLLAQAMRVYTDRAHTGLNRTKTRGEVVRTTKKWFRQKGTGNARHGARSAPIFVGGGVAHGPDGRSRTLTLPLKMKRKALKSAIASKLSNKQIGVLAGVGQIKKTKEAYGILTKTDHKGKMTIVLADANKDNAKYFNNISKLDIVTYSNLNAYSVFSGGYIVFDEDIFAKNKAKATKEKTK